MKPGRMSLFIQSILYYWRTHLSIFLGTVFSTAVLVGALIIGDSVQYSLKEHTMKRLGKTACSLELDNRYVRVSLADALAEELHTPAVPVLRLSGIVSKEGGTLRTGMIQVFGVDENFWKLGRDSAYHPDLKTGQAVINQRLASKAGLERGDALLLRMRKLGRIPYNVPFSEKEETSVSLRLQVKDIASDERMGLFSLKTHQGSPLTIFLPLSRLSQKIGLDERINLILIAGRENTELSKEECETALRHSWQPADLGIRFNRMSTTGMTELTSERIFLPESIVSTALAAHESAQGIFSYFINTIRNENRTTPYSFISAPGKPFVHTDMSNDEIIISSWLASDLNAAKGDRLELAYYIPTQHASLPDQSLTLVEEMSGFTIKDIFPQEKDEAIETLVPFFPGLSDAGTCSDWNPGIPIDLSRVRKKDEAYWNLYGSTPKAYVTLNAAQSMWSNSFGNLTAIRYNIDEVSLQELEDAVMSNLHPFEEGFSFVPVLEKGIAASQNAVDFGGLFLGLSFFIITATLLIVGLLFIFEVEYRSGELGLLKALGFSNLDVSSLFYIEGLIISITGSIIGSFFGILYNKLILYGLTTIWIGAVGTQTLGIYLQPSTIVTGIILNSGLSVSVMLFATGHLLKKPVARIQQEAKQYDLFFETGRYWMSILIVIASIIGIAIILILLEGNITGSNAPYFMLVGSLILACILASFHLIFIYMGKEEKHSVPGVVRLVFRSLSRRKKRSITVIALLACSIFIITAVGANQKFPLHNPLDRSSGTGGFTLFGETTLPFFIDLSREVEDMDILSHTSLNNNVQFVQMKVHEGDDASCLNLNRITEPQIIGVKPESFAARHAFTFAQMNAEIRTANPWLTLEQEIDNYIPAIADQTVITWGLGKAVGDTLTYLNEWGKPFQVKLVGGLNNSIFQGNIIISEKHFNKQFPSEDGYRLFLVDSPTSFGPAIAELLEEKYKTFGIELESTIERLARFTVVENTYLSIFLMLGGLGLLIGTIGFGVVLYRKMAERRKEHALFLAIGFSRCTLSFFILFENFFLLVTGILAGCIASFGALIPIIISQSQTIPAAPIGIIVAGIFIHGSIWTVLISRRGITGNIIDELRNE